MSDEVAVKCGDGLRVGEAVRAAIASEPRVDQTVRVGGVADSKPQEESFGAGDAGSGGGVSRTVGHELGGGDSRAVGSVQDIPISAFSASSEFVDVVTVGAGVSAEGSAAASEAISLIVADRTATRFIVDGAVLNGGRQTPSLSIRPVAHLVVADLAVEVLVHAKARRRHTSSREALHEKRHQRQLDHLYKT